MAASFVAADGLDLSSATSTWTLTFSNIVPASGDIVVLAACWTQARTISSVQDDLSASWTALDGGYNSGEARGAFYYKVLSGSETSVTLTLSGGASGYIAAVQLTGVASSSVLDAADIDNFSDPTQTPATASVSSTADGIAVAAIGTYFVNNFNPSSANSFSNSFVKRLDSTDVQGSVARSGVIFGTLVYTGSGSRSTTLTTTDTGDEAWAGIALFKAAATGYEDLTLNAGSYALTGQSATLTAARKLDLNVGSYALTGQSASLLRGFQLDLNAGSYALTGQSATLTAARSLTLNAGSYALTGYSVDLTYTPQGAYDSLRPDAGSYALTGYSATLTSGRKLDLEAGSYALTGYSVELTYTEFDSTLTLEPGSYELTGYSVELTYSGEAQATSARRGAARSRFVEARKRLPMSFLVDWLTNDEPSEETKRVITEIKAGRPIPRDIKPPKGPSTISADRLAKEILPNRAFVFEHYLGGLVDANRTILKAVEIAIERDDEDVLMLMGATGYASVSKARSQDDEDVLALL